MLREADILYRAKLGISFSMLVMLSVSVAVLGQTPDVKVTVVPATFRLFDPAEFRVEVTNTSTTALSATIPIRSDLGLRVISGAAEIAKPHALAPLMIPCRDGAELWAGSSRSVTFPLCTLLKLNAPGEIEVSYAIRLVVSKRSNDLDVAEICPSGIVRFAVQPRSEADVEQLTGELAAAIGNASDERRWDPLDKLVAITHPFAIEALKRAWEGSTPQERVKIVDALVRIGTEDAMSVLDTFSRQFPAESVSEGGGGDTVEWYVIHRVSGWAASSQPSEIPPSCFKIWRRGAESQDTLVRDRARLLLDHFATNAVPQQW